MKRMKRILGKTIRQQPSSPFGLQLTTQSLNGSVAEAESDLESGWPPTENDGESIVESAGQSCNDAEQEYDVESVVEASRQEFVKECGPSQRRLVHSRDNHLGSKIPCIRSVKKIERGNGLRTSSKQDLSFKIFLGSLLLSVTGLPLRWQWILLVFYCMLLIYEARSLTTALDSGLGDATEYSVLNFGEAIAKLLPFMRNNTLLVVCYPLIMLLGCPRALVLQIFPMMVLIFVPYIYFPEPMYKLSRTRVDVACGSFKLSLISFTISGTLLLSLTCVLLILVGLYLIWRYILKGKPSLVEKVDINVTDLPYFSQSQNLN